MVLGSQEKKVKLDFRLRDGKRSEILAVEWLLQQGCYVYTPAVEQGPIDVIALNPAGVLILFDVKTVGRRKNGSIISRKLTDIQIKLGVRLLYVDLETGRCALYPHQLSKHPPNQYQKMADSKIAIRLGSEKAPTISSLLHPESSQTDQSSSEEP